MQTIVKFLSRRGCLFLLLFLLVYALSGCASTRYVPTGDMLLARVSIVSDTTEVDAEVLPTNQLLNHLSQRPNRKLFGLFNWSLGIYNLSGSGNTWLNRRLRRWGDAPVVFNAEEAERSATSLTAILYNKGYLDAHTTYTVDTISRRKVAVRYHLAPGRLFRVGRYEERIEQSMLDSLVHPLDTMALRKYFPTETYRTRLVKGSPLSTELMQQERRRLVQILRNRGYWGLNEGHMHFDVDTLPGHDSVWVQLRIDSLHQPYRIGNVTVTQLSNNRAILPKVLNRRVWIRPGGLYTEEYTRRTYSALADLGAISSVGIQYTVDTVSAAPVLNCEITTTDEQSKEVVLDLIGTHSSGNLGANASVALVHNNLFGGAEYAKLLSRVGYERLGGAAQDHLNYGFEASLSLPRLLLPFASPKRRPTKATTDLSLGYDYQTRPEFSRDIFSASWGYSWVTFSYPALRYSLKAIEVDYMHFGYINEGFIGNLPSITRALNYRDQFVLGSSILVNYLSSLDYRLKHSRWVHNVRIFAQSAGNLLYGFSSLVGARRDELGAYSLMNINYAQFVKGEIDYSGLYKLEGKNALAYHAALAVLYPYGNSRVLPIDLRYFSGGGNSLRGWNARELGPGGMPYSVGRSIFQQVGDIKLDLSAELRTRISSSWELALFLDAGNIWTVYPYDNQPGGEFRWDSFYKQIALSTGLGVRWDFDLFLLRLDLGAKLYDPQAVEGRRWAVGHYKPQDLFALHFALGYPF